MSYPFGFDLDPRGFYFRSVYFPNGLLFSSVLIVAYRVADDIRARSRTILTAIFFTTITLAYHFEFGDGTIEYWGLVDSFLTGLAALAAACVWQGTRIEARVLAWSVALSFVSATSILVKPAGTFVAAIAGIAWVAFALVELTSHSVSIGQRRSSALRFFGGAALIGLTDAATVTAALASRYLSPENLAFGQGAVAILRAEFHFSLSELWPDVNAGLGGAFLLWGGLAATTCAWALLRYGTVAVTAKYFIALAGSLGAVAFGFWFWFVTGGAQIRYVMPFFVIGMIWLVPVAARASRFAPSVLKLGMSSVMIVAALNLILLLLAPQPSVAWQRLAGVDVTATFPPETAASFLLLAEKTSNIYVASLDQNDAILESIVDQAWLQHGGPPLTMHRPIDWVRPSTFRIAEIAAAEVLLINPKQAWQAPAGSVVHSLYEEQGVLTAWADKLGASDGVATFFSAPSTKILNIVEPVKFRESLDRLTARYSWDPTFVEANHLPPP